MADPTDANDVVERKFRGQPRKRVLEDLNKTMVGLVALAVLTALLATLVIITKVGPGYRRISAEFIQAAALMPKNPVTVAGIPVGTVTGMELIGDRVRVDMRVQDDIEVGKDSRAVIMVTTILGSRYLALHPGGGGPLPNNTIDLNHTEVPYDLQQALQDGEVPMGQYYHDVTELARADGFPVRSTFPKEGGVVDSGGWLVSKASEKQEEAQVFMDYTSSPEIQTKLSLNVGTAPVMAREHLDLTDEEFASVSSDITPIVPQYHVYLEQGDWISDRWTEMISS